jgi:molybdate transport system substrate-binding protein
MKIFSVTTAIKICFGFMLALVQAHSASAAEIKVLSVVPLKSAVDELGPQFERATGHKLAMTYDGSSQLKRKFEANEPFDVALIYPELIDELVKQGKLDAGIRADIAIVMVGVAIKKGAPKPDVSTVEAFKRTLLDAKSISHSTEGASGVYFQGLIQRFGIAAELKPKLRPVEGGNRVVGPVAKGEVEIAVITLPFIFLDPGAELAGPLPKELQHPVIYTASMSAATKQPDAAKAFIKHLTTPAAAAVIKSKGLQPANQ